MRPHRNWIFCGSIAVICSVGVSTIATNSLMWAQQNNDTEAYIIATLRQDSRLKLKRILLALHNYHAEHKQFPTGTHPNPKLKPDKRISWAAAILPYFEQQPLYDRIVFDKSWDDKANHGAITTTVEGLLNPGLEKPKEGDLPPTHYVGLAGLGADGPTLPVESPRAGCFGYNRATRLEDIKDGTSDTMMISEASKDYGSWAAGGRPTIRSLTKEPVMNGPDGFGGPWEEGMLVGFADGSVRFCSKHIDAKLFRGLITINGHEEIKLPKAP